MTLQLEESKALKVLKLHIQAAVEVIHLAAVAEAHSVAEAAGGGFR
jgi:hypothetical protein